MAKQKNNVMFVKERTMSKMGYIAYLAENNMRDELVEEVGSSRIADGFIEAAEQIEKNKEKEAYKVLYKLQQQHIEEGEKEYERRKGV
tara:strand:+ start:2255 stop:2518 length:264 start_codon:yes stop_codon:yes gene_type:complete